VNLFLHRGFVFFSILLLGFSSSPSLFSDDGNLFLIDFNETAHPSNADYLAVQEKLQLLDPANSPLLIPFDSLTREDYRRRIETGKNLILIDPGRSLYPKIICQKIGKGGPNCVVTYASYNREYYKFALEIPENLKKLKFNGWFFCRLGGYPNPTGNELRYAGYPYAWKIFMIHEAFKRGFENVLWIDSPMRPLRNPRWLFKMISRHGGLFLGKGTYDWGGLYTVINGLLVKHFGYPSRDRHIQGMVIGLKRSERATQRLLAKWYSALTLEKGFLFATNLPEEILLDSLIPVSGFPDKVYVTELGLGLSHICVRSLNCRSKRPFFQYRAH
jgi:hypothetical protein